MRTVDDSAHCRRYSGRSVSPAALLPLRLRPLRHHAVRVAWPDSAPAPRLGRRAGVRVGGASGAGPPSAAFPSERLRAQSRRQLLHARVGGEGRVGRASVGGWGAGCSHDTRVVRAVRGVARVAPTGATRAGDSVGDPATQTGPADTGAARRRRSSVHARRRWRASGPRRHEAERASRCRGSRAASRR